MRIAVNRKPFYGAAKLSDEKITLRSVNGEVNGNQLALAATNHSGTVLELTRPGALKYLCLRQITNTTYTFFVRITADKKVVYEGNVTFSRYLTPFFVGSGVNLSSGGNIVTELKKFDSLKIEINNTNATTVYVHGHLEMS